MRTSFIAAFLLFICSCNGSQKTFDEETKNLQVKLEQPKRPQFVSNEGESRKLWNLTKQVYASRQFRPAWSANHRSDSADRLMRTFDNAPAEGLHPDDVSELHAMRDAVGSSNDVSAAADFDLHLTYSLVRYVSQLCFGRVDPHDVDSNWERPQKDCDVQRIVSDAIDKNQFESIADQLAPPLPEYKGLKASLRRYREIAAQGGWKSVPANAAKQPDAYMSAVAQNLALMGDADSDVAAALRAFELRHGLEPSGKLNDKNIRAINVPVQDRIEQIETNMDRMRWTDKFEPEHVRVNIPAFDLSVHDGDQVPLRMKVIVGAEDKRTPIFSGEMQSIVFSPYWNIPLSIAKKELLPKIRKDPQYLERQHIDVIRSSGKGVQTIDPSEVDWDQSSEQFNYQLRQRPGASNSLGLVKFMFPNPFNVYLHDTPADNLFGRLERSLSHGCIRLERPAELAAYVLKDQPEWTPERIDAAMHAQEEKHVPLKTHLPVHIFYWTAWVDSEGVTQFRDDVYGFDEKHKALVDSHTED